MKLTASDRSALIHLASDLPAGSDERRAILSGLSKEKREESPEETEAMEGHKKTYQQIKGMLGDLGEGLKLGDPRRNVSPNGKTLNQRLTIGKGSASIEVISVTDLKTGKTRHKAQKQLKEVELGEGDIDQEKLKAALDRFVNF